MRNRKRLIAAVMAAGMVLTMSAPALAAEEAAQVISGEVISEEAVRAGGDAVVDVKDSVITAEGSMRPGICSGKRKDRPYQPGNRKQPVRFPYGQGLCQ